METIFDNVKLEPSSIDETLLKDSTFMAGQDLDSIEDALLKTPTKTVCQTENETLLLEETALDGSLVDTIIVHSAADSLVDQSVVEKPTQSPNDSLVDTSVLETPTQNQNDMTLIDEDDEISFKVKVDSFIRKFQKIRCFLIGSKLV